MIARRVVIGGGVDGPADPGGDGDRDEQGSGGTQPARRASPRALLALDGIAHAQSYAVDIQRVMERLRELIVRAKVEPKVRRKVKPSRAAKARRVDEKKRRGAIKSLRRSSRDD